MFFKTPFGNFLKLYPCHAGIFIRLNSERNSFIRFKKINHIIMQMPWHKLAFFDMIADRQNINIKRHIQQRTNILNSRFFLRFLNRHKLQILHAISMPADPCPGIKHIVKNHQHFIPRRIDNPGRRAEMSRQILSGKSLIAKSVDKLQKRSLLRRFNIIFRLIIADDLLPIYIFFLTNGSFPTKRPLPRISARFPQLCQHLGT